MQMVTEMQSSLESTEKKHFILFGKNLAKDVNSIVILPKLNDIETTVTDLHSHVYFSLVLNNNTYLSSATRFYTYFHFSYLIFDCVRNETGELRK